MASPDISWDTSRHFREIRGTSAQGEVLDMELLKQDLAALVQKVDSLVERL